MPSGDQCATSDVRRGADSYSSALDADLVEPARDAFGGVALPRAGLGAVVRRVDADQLAAELDDLAVRVRARRGVGPVVRRSRRVGHRAILFPASGADPGGGGE